MFVNSFRCVVVGIEHGGGPFIAQLLKGIADLFRVLIGIVELFQDGQDIGDSEAQFPGLAKRSSRVVCLKFGFCSPIRRCSQR